MHTREDIGQILWLGPEEMISAVARALCAPIALSVADLNLLKMQRALDSCRIYAFDIGPKSRNGDEGAFAVASPRAKNMTWRREKETAGIESGGSSLGTQVEQALFRA